MADETKKNKEKKRFFKDFKSELKKVIWPTPKQIVNNTIAVITIVIVTAVIVLILDLAFEAMNTYGINKLRNIVSKNETIVEEIPEEDETIEDSDETYVEEIEETESVNNDTETAEEVNETDNAVQE